LNDRGCQFPLCKQLAHPRHCERSEPTVCEYGAYTTPAEIMAIDKGFGGDGLVAIHKKKRFRAVATALHDLGGGSQRLWVLCELMTAWLTFSLAAGVVLALAWWPW
jgi:hypothetical protein